MGKRAGSLAVVAQKERSDAEARVERTLLSADFDFAF